MIGKTLAHYEITSLLGKGGMGEVYRAKDQKLGRDVAIKVLPTEFARDADRVARFQREAKLLASLNHPNIAAIHGLEEDKGTNFLVLELVEGQTLAELIAGNAGVLAGKGAAETAALPGILKIALQIAEALEAAHEKGIIHRDLKPANIKITPEGKVKVLDFGLAKAFTGEQEKLNLSNSPTLSDAATQQGVILGTAAYMSPEQARGKTVDKRADIWAFGCVLYETLTGQAAFQGEDVTEILAAVVKSSANLDLLPPNLHPRVREAITRCLQKDLRRRYPGITDARYEIEQALADPGGMLALAVAGMEPRTRLRTILPWIGVALALGAIVAGVLAWKLKPPEPRQVIRFEYALPAGQQIRYATFPSIDVSPNGKQFVYSTSKGLYLRSMDEKAARPIAGTEEEDTAEPFFSPDGKWIGYGSVTDHKIKKVAVNGGMPVALCEVPIFYGASWHEQDAIVYGPTTGDIMRISANGGTPESIARRNSGPLVYPQMLPDGKSLLYTAATSNTQGKIMIQSLKSGEPRELFPGYDARYIPTGHIIYRALNKLIAVPFDLGKLEVAGGHVPVVEDVQQAAVSSSGTLAYIPGNPIGDFNKCALMWVSREGKEKPLSALPNDYMYPKISPDGKRLALTINAGGNEDIWIWDSDRETMTRLTFEEGEDSWPLWTADGQYIIYRSSRDGTHYDIKRKAADGGGEIEKLGSLPDVPGPFALTKDGKTMLSWDLVLSPLKTNITAMSLDGSPVQKPLLKDKFNADHPQISPDGGWMAYVSNESGQNEIFVRRFPEVSKGRWQISTGGGIGPLWSPDGHELYFRNGESVLSVSVETGPVFKAGKPKVLFQGKYLSVTVGQAVLPMWDISPDGKRFLMMKEMSSSSADEGPRKINIVINWFEELKQRVPIK